MIVDYTLAVARGEIKLQPPAVILPQINPGLNGSYHLPYPISMLAR